VKAPIAALALLALLLAGCGGGPAGAPAPKAGESAPAGASVQYPRLTGRVVDTADLLNPAQEAELTGKLEALQRASSRQLVVATVPNLQGRSIEDYGVGLGRFWRIGQGAANNGALLIVAVAEKKIRIEIGYGLEGILTDALASQIIRERITPRFQANDYAGGIIAGADAIVAQLQAPREAAEQRVAEASRAQSGDRARRGNGSSPFGLIIWGVVLLFILLSLVGRGLHGRRYGRRVSIWGPGDRSGGLGWMAFGMALGSLGGRRGGGGGWGGGWGGGGSGGGGGFSGGGGSFGGGGASGGW
jgi:uncharacterized protein